MPDDFDAEETSKMTSRMIEAMLGAQELGPSYTIPEHAGGSNELGEQLADMLAQALGMWQPKKQRKAWANRLLEIAKSYDAVAVAVEALEMMLSPDAEVAWKTYRSPFGAGFERDYQSYLGQAMAGTDEREQVADWYEEYGDLIDR
jgi:hypothetical protein